MNIAIDISPLSSGHKGRGVGKYTRLLVESLEKYESQHSYTTFIRGEKLPKNIDLVHYPYFDPFFLTLPISPDTSMIVTVHDLIPIVFPNKFQRGIRGEVKWQIQRVALKNAKKIIADSESSKRDVSALVGYNSRDISVVHLAPNPRVVAGAKFSEKGEKFFVYVGDLNWNKNIEGLLRGFSQSKTSVQLMIVGKAFLEEKLPEAIAVRELVKNLGLSLKVRFLGHVSDTDLGGLYTSSVACILPSFYEGFGLSVLEAMACGTPVIASLGSSLDEVAGPSLRIDPNNLESIALALEKLAALPILERKSLIEKGKIWSSRFSWKRVAHETVDVYKSTITGS